MSISAKKHWYVTANNDVIDIILREAVYGFRTVYRPARMREKVRKSTDCSRTKRPVEEIVGLSGSRNDLRSKKSWRDAYRCSTPSYFDCNDKPS